MDRLKKRIQRLSAWEAALNRKRFETCRVVTTFKFGGIKDDDDGLFQKPDDGLDRDRAIWSVVAHADVGQTP